MLRLATAICGWDQDGWRSVVAQAVQPAQYHDKPRLLAAYYTYYSGLPVDGRFEVYSRPDRAFAA